MNVNPFKADAAKRLERNLAAACSTRDKLAERLKAAELAVTERQAAAQQLARDAADDAALDVAEAASRNASERVATLSAALAETKQEVARLERERDDLADRKLRAETAAAIEAMADEIVKAGAAFDAGATQLVESSSRVAAIVLDGHGLQAFAMNARAEVPAAVAMIAKLLQDCARATIAGTAPAALPQAAPVPEPEQPPPPPRTEQLFLMRHVKWTDAAGQLRFGPQFVDAELPPEAAARALKSGAAIVMTDPRRKQLHGTKAPRLPDPSWCLDLDQDPASPTTEPVVHSAFEHIDRGPPRTMKVTRGGLNMNMQVSTRLLDLRPTSYNAEYRTVDAVLSKGSPVTRIYGTEALKITSDAIDLARVHGIGVPLLDSHQQIGISNALGLVRAAWVEGGALLGTLQFNQTREGKKAEEMVARKEINGVSIGYRVQDWEITDSDGRAIDPAIEHTRWNEDDLTFTASKWELLEVSLCAVAADDAAGIRAYTDRAYPLNTAIAEIRTRMRVRQNMLSRQQAAFGSSFGAC